MELTAPGPSGLDMLRGAPSMIRDPLGFLGTQWRRHGDVVQFPIPNPPTYLVNHPDAVDRVLRANHKNYGKDTLQYRRLSLLTGFGLLTADTDLWRTQRPVVQPAFGADLVPMVEKATHAACARIEWPEGVRDVDADILRITLEVVGEVLFGADLTGDAADLAEATLSGLEVVVKKSSPLSAPMWMPTPNNRQLATAKARLDRAVRELTATPAPEGTLLRLLQDGADPRTVRDQVVTFLVAGHETVASGLAWSLYLLAQHPTDASSAEVFDEALRLYPPAWLITRQALGPDEFGGIGVPEGALIITSPYWLHRHPATWDDPEEFQPGRSLPRTGYVPFGAGPRLCIGRGMSLVEAPIILDHLRQRYRFEVVREVRMKPEVTIRPVGGMPLRVSRL
ncbi:MAG: cytochrome P450 [Actinobacteria bacterium]|nr:cytochrome P450 [Actinomycetota bacterium]MCB8997162.1 cytochrome P450 [Actinomycetota bacterium]HRY10284.1 cytochrome P450 [Candidatus Nanopelagicales bacterium]